MRDKRNIKKKGDQMSSLHFLLFSKPNVLSLIDRGEINSHSVYVYLTEVLSPEANLRFVCCL